jgi:hypothetical protein
MFGRGDQATGDHGVVSLIAHPRSGRVRERLIAALVPDAAAHPELVPPAPLPMLPALRRIEQTSPATLLVATARMDGSGRVHERLLLRALGWEPGHRLDMDIVHGLIVAAAAPTGPYVIDDRGALRLPAQLRHLCGIEPGPSLVLVLTAVVDAQVLVVHPAITVAELLAGHYTTVLTGCGGS